MKPKLKVGDELFTREQMIEFATEVNDSWINGNPFNITPELPSPAIVISEEPMGYYDSKFFDKHGVCQLFTSSEFDGRDEPLWKHPPIENKLKVADIRDLEKRMMLGEISYSKMVELINDFKSKLTNKEETK